MCGRVLRRAEGHQGLLLDIKPFCGSHAWAMPRGKYFWNFFATFQGENFHPQFWNLRRQFWDFCPQFWDFCPHFEISSLDFCIFSLNRVGGKVLVFLPKYLPLAMPVGWFPAPPPHTCPHIRYKRTGSKKTCLPGKITCLVSFYRRFARLIFQEYFSLPQRAHMKQLQLGENMLSRSCFSDDQNLYDHTCV